MVSAYSEMAIFGLTSHSDVNGFRRAIISVGCGAAFAKPYGVMKFRSACENHTTPADDFEGDFAGEY
jgi:hypothetical protein